MNANAIRSEPKFGLKQKYGQKMQKCESGNILSGADAAAMGGWEECERAFACAFARVCVCFDSLQRKLDTCGIPRDREDSWLLVFGAMSNDIINTNTAIKATQAQMHQRRRRWRPRTPQG